MPPREREATQGEHPTRASAPSSPQLSVVNLRACEALYCSWSIASICRSNHPPSNKMTGELSFFDLVVYGSCSDAHGDTKREFPELGPCYTTVSRPLGASRRRWHKRLRRQQSLSTVCVLHCSQAQTKSEMVMGSLRMAQLIELVKIRWGRMRPLHEAHDSDCSSHCRPNLLRFQMDNNNIEDQIMKYL